MRVVAMTPWIDGMGRRTVKWLTGAASRYDCVLDEHRRLVGICRAPGWIVIKGPFQANVIGLTRADHERSREVMAQRARHYRLPGALRNQKWHLQE